MWASALKLKKIVRKFRFHSDFAIVTIEGKCGVLLAAENNIHFNKRPFFNSKGFLNELREHPSRAYDLSGNRHKKIFNYFFFCVFDSFHFKINKLPRKYLCCLVRRISAHYLLNLKIVKCLQEINSKKEK